MEDRPIYSALMLAGVTPFLASALLPLTGVEDFGPLGRPDRLASAYGLAIICFLTGIHWATQLYARESAPFNLFIGSNIVFLAVWIAYVATSLQWALATQLLAFPLLLAIDYRLCRKDLISRQYLRLRFIATALACFSLLFILVS
ncbi:MAG: DUF3429 family protein [Woeseiaceae bacterium]|nr:DUF3429 family protein [Woeseiaceae bacterium]